MYTLECFFKKIIWLSLHKIYATMWLKSCPVLESFYLNLWSAKACFGKIFPGKPHKEHALKGALRP